VGGGIKRVGRSVEGARVGGANNVGEGAAVRIVGLLVGLVEGSGVGIFCHLKVGDTVGIGVGAPGVKVGAAVPDGLGADVGTGVGAPGVKVGAKVGIGVGEPGLKVGALVTGRGMPGMHRSDAPNRLLDVKPTLQMQMDDPTREKLFAGQGVHCKLEEGNSRVGVTENVFAGQTWQVKAAFTEEPNQPRL